MSPSPPTNTSPRAETAGTCVCLRPPRWDHRGGMPLVPRAALAATLLATAPRVGSAARHTVVVAYICQLSSARCRHCRRRRIVLPPRWQARATATAVDATAADIAAAAPLCHHNNGDIDFFAVHVGVFYSLRLSTPPPLVPSPPLARSQVSLAVVVTSSRSPTSRWRRHRRR